MPSEKLSNLKLEISSNLLEPTEENDLLESEDSIKLTYNNDKTIQMESYLKLLGLSKGLETPSEGKSKLTLSVFKFPQLKVDGNYKFTPTEEKKTATMDVNASFGDKKATLHVNNEYRPDVAVVNMNAKCDLQLENLRNIEMDLVYKVQICIRILLLYRSEWKRLRISERD